MPACCTFVLGVGSDLVNGPYDWMVQTNQCGELEASTVSRDSGQGKQSGPPEECSVS